jgi:NAD(P)H-dependent flavin oxidoreductase YrpB (nitropropane dioxygenase family)
MTRSDGAIVEALQTPLCQMLGIEWPVLSVGFGAGAGPELVAAVSGAGGFGVLGATGMPAEFIRAQCERTRGLADAPFGVNLIVAQDPDADAEEQAEDVTYFRSAIAAASTGGATAVVLFWGDPAPYVAAAHDQGLRVLIQVGSAAEAQAVVEAGVDAVIAQGIEAGGHIRGRSSIWQLLPETVDAVSPTPVLASGGIGDGAGLARALRLGAQGVSLGTRFVATDEANAHPGYKARIIASEAGDTVYTEDLYDVGWPGAPHRTLRNRLFAEWDAAGRPPSGARPGEGTAIGRRAYPWLDGALWLRYSPGMATADFDGELDYAPLWAGEACSVVDEVKPAAVIVRELVEDAAAGLER